MNRRAFLASALAAGPLVRAGHARLRAWGTAPESSERTLVLLQLSGGNDGLSLLVPYTDDAYYRARSSTAISSGASLRLDERRALHPELGRLREHFDQGEVAFVEGVGYPEPNRSHFASLDIWHTANLQGRSSGEGWVGRLMAELYRKDADPNHVVHIGTSLPYSLRSTDHPPTCFANPASYRWVKNEQALGEYDTDAGEGTSSLDFVRAVMRDAHLSSRAMRTAAATYRARAEYPDREPLAEALHTAAAMIHGGLGTRVISVELGGFDTHVDQRASHTNLMGRLDRSLSAFLRDLQGTSAGRNTIVAAFSEFGRRVAENGSGGTDHGTAGVLMVAGESVKGGFYGKSPSLTKLDELGDLRFTTDFRSVYATAIERWMGCASKPVLGERFEPLDFIPG